MIKAIVWLLFASTLHAELKMTKATGSIIRTKGKLQTGSSSRLEVELPYLGIVRIGSNADFKHSLDGRDLKLDKGTMLFSAPKGSGDVIISSGPVATAITNGGDLEVSNVGGSSKVIVLNGKIVVSLVNNPSKSRQLRFGQMVDVPAGAVDMPAKAAFNMGVLLKTSSLFNMGPLPSSRAIKQNATKQSPPGRPFFVTGGFDPDWGGTGGGSLLTTIGPAGTAAMVGRIEQGKPLPPPPVIAPDQIPTQAQVVALEAAGLPVPNVTQADSRRILRGVPGIRDRLRERLRERLRPPVMVQPTPPPAATPPPVISPPIATPIPRPTQGPIIRPTPRPPIAVP